MTNELTKSNTNTVVDRACHGGPGSVLNFNPLRTRHPKTGTLANFEDPDEMPHKASFIRFSTVC